MTIKSIEDWTGTHCVDLISNQDGTISVKEFRRDPEDIGKWTMVADYSKSKFKSEHEACEAISKSIPWLRAALENLN